MISRAAAFSIGGAILEKPSEMMAFSFGITWTLPRPHPARQAGPSGKMSTGHFVIPRSGSSPSGGATDNDKTVIPL